METMHIMGLGNILKMALNLPVGYHNPAKYIRTGRRVNIDRKVPNSLLHFIHQCARFAEDQGVEEHVGVAYMRVIDAGTPENYMKWHRDNLDGGMRFHTAVSSDGIPTNLVFPFSKELEGTPVAETPTPHEYVQPANGDLVMFTTEVHGVPHLPSRPGEKTAVFFTTMYKSWEAVDYTHTNNAATTEHAVLPQLDKEMQASGGRVT